MFTLVSARRTPQEYARGSVAGSVNIPFFLYENGDETTGELVDNDQFAEQAKALIGRPQGHIVTAW
jgi:hypothetical protein